MLQRIAVAASLAALSTAVPAADVAVFPPSAVNLSAGQAEAIGAVMAQAYARASNADVLPPRQAAAAGLDPSRMPEAAAALGVAEYIEVGAVGLLGNGSDSRIVIQATRRTQRGEVIHRAELTATSMGDVEIVAERLARALWERKSAEATRDVHTVTGKEAARENRTFTEKTFGPKLGFILPMANGKRYDPLIAFGGTTRLEGRSFFLEFGTGLAVPRSMKGDRALQGYGLI